DRRALATGPGLPDRAHPRARVHVARELPGPRRPRAGRGPLGADPAQGRGRLRDPSLAARHRPCERLEGAPLPQKRQAGARAARVETMPAGLTVAVTGPTGDIGRSLLRALERSGEVERIVAM